MDTDRWMDGWMDVWVDGHRHRWIIGGWMDGWMDVWVDGHRHRWMDGRKDAWVDGYRHRWMDLSDSYLIQVFKNVFIQTQLLHMHLKMLNLIRCLFLFSLLTFSLPFFSLSLYNTSGLINLFNEVHSSELLQGFVLMKNTGLMGLVVLDSGHDWLVFVSYVYALDLYPAD